MRPSWSSVGSRALLAHAGVLAALGFLPLCGGPTYEFALITGLISPLWVCLIAAGRLSRLELNLYESLQRGTNIAAIALCSAAFVALGHGLRVGHCDFWAQWGFYSLGPLCGILLGGVWGGAVAGATRQLPSSWRGPSALILAASAPIGCVLVSLWRYYTSPIIFAFDPFVGFFAGTLYDTVIDGSTRLLSYRAGGAGSVVALFLVARMSVSFTSARRKVKTLLVPATLALFAGLLSIGVTLHGPALGHFQTEGSIRKALGHSVSVKRCEVVYASGIPVRDARALALECDGHLIEQAGYFEIEAPEHVTVYLFANASQKARLMGARRVYIAKPWRREIYIQAAGFPHPVLGHELAHISAGSFGQGPFRIAGPLGGWIPDPGRIEGVAVAASPRMDGSLTTQQWAAAMHRLNLLPELSRVFRLSFLGANSRAAYTVAGAFVGWLHHRYGAGAIRHWYAGLGVQEAFGASLDNLERAFIESLEAVSISPQAMAVARERFERPGVFGRRCPHQVDAVQAKARRTLRQLHDPAKAESLYREVLTLDPKNFEAKFGLAQCRAKRENSRDSSASANTLEALRAQPELGQAQRLRVSEAIADALLGSGQAGQAALLYDSLRADALSESHLRTLEVKSRAATSPLAQAALQSLFAGNLSADSDWGVTIHALALWSERIPEEALPDYLLGRNLVARGQWREGAVLLDAALSKKFRSARVQREAWRARALVGCALGQQTQAGEAATQYLADMGSPPVQREGFQRFAQRCGLLSD